MSDQIITLIVDGDDYDNFDSANVTVRLDALCNTFDFTVTPDNGEALPFDTGEACEVKVNGELALTGFIEIITVDYGRAEHTISISGRDKTADFLDSSLEKLANITPPITLKQIIEKIIEEIDGLDLKVIDNFNPPKFENTEDLIAVESGDNAFDIAEKYARKRQALLSSTPEGDILITQGEGTQTKNLLQNQLNDPANNILSASFSDDLTGRYNVYRLNSTSNPIALLFAGKTSLADSVNQGNGVSDDRVRAGRQLVLTSETASSKTENEKRAQWEQQIRAARGKVYSCTVDGFFDLGDEELWAVNTICEIQDVFCKLSGSMLINSVDFMIDSERGSMTNLSFVELDAYTTGLNEPLKKKESTFAFLKQ